MIKWIKNIIKGIRYWVFFIYIKLLLELQWLHYTDIFFYEMTLDLKCHWRSQKVKLNILTKFLLQINILLSDNFSCLTFLMIILVLVLVHILISFLVICIMYFILILIILLINVKVLFSKEFGKKRQIFCGNLIKVLLS